MESSVESQHSRGVALLRSGRLSEAEAFFVAHVQRQPNIADFHAGLANVRQAQGRLDEAIAGYKAALRLKSLPIVQNRLGIALCQLGRLAEAAAVFEEALALEPTFIEVRCNLGMTLFHLGNTDRCNGLILQAIALKPDHAESWLSLATAAFAFGSYADADMATSRTLALVPNHGTALALRALAARQLGRLTEASLTSRRAAALDPQQADMLATAAMVRRDVGRSEEAIHLFRRALALQPQHKMVRSSFIMCLNYVSTVTPAELLAESQEWERRHALPSAPRRSLVLTDKRPLRVGLVSGDFRRHPVGYFLDGVLPNLDKNNIATVCFSTSPSVDAFTNRFRAAAAGWHDISTMSDDTAFELIGREAIDVLVDMSGHTGGGRLSLFARRPAKVQASWIGYFGTTGLSSIDWLIADRHLVPEGADRWYSERVMRLPDSYVCYTPPEAAPLIAPPPSDRNGYVTFGCCNAVAKISPATISAWVRILAQVPRSRLLLKASAFDTAEARHHLIDTLANRGIYIDRLTLEGWSPYGEFLDVYSRIDVALDPFPFCGGLTTLETLWMGVPLVSLASDRFAGRQSLSYLSTIGHGELCAMTEDDYVHLAVKLGQDAGERRRLRATLRDDMARSPLLDGARFADNLTAAFETIVRMKADGAISPESRS